MMNDKHKKIKDIISKFIKSKENYKMKKVCFYYGVPSKINNLKDINDVVSFYSNYDIVVFGDEYQLKTNEFYDETKRVIKKIIDNKPSIEIFGYVPCACENGGKNLYTNEIKTLIDCWKELNVTGIFYDEFGYDYGNTRERQNELILYGKNLNLNAFVNSWRDEYIFSNESMVLDWMGNFEPNPNRIESLLDKNDYALYENMFWGVNNNTQIGSKVDSLQRAYEYYNVAQDEYQMTYSKRYGTGIICLDGIYSDLNEGKKIELKSISLLGAALLNIDGIGFGNECWGSNGNFEDFEIPNIEMFNSLEKHKVKCIYGDYPKGYKAAIRGEKIELTWEVHPKVETKIEQGKREIRINNNIISNLYKI